MGDTQLKPTPRDGQKVNWPGSEPPPPSCYTPMTATEP
uniref:Uncharacterized protein n=1 Tax=Heterorhabditis bacteriophora TaxID=37862 RepID=A0A1I7WYA3_HETBA